MSPWGLAGAEGANRDSSYESRTGQDVRAFPDFLQDRNGVNGVWSHAVTLATWTAVARSACCAVNAWIAASTARHATYSKLLRGSASSGVGTFARGASPSCVASAPWFRPRAESLATTCTRRAANWGRIDRIERHSLRTILVPWPRTGTRALTNNEYYRVSCSMRLLKLLGFSKMTYFEKPCNFN
jgi:hypothetical protein